ncbi:Major facilitator superfamily [Kalmanozyma brasiliensis GHG001]|uniref:Transporter n=1 Tax=Kalmanozyma brasiliensis (strain GHG001) TaxID=1365824 RepID=V5F019_KALBG|nr:Major facilitator superfamily [Kalmanozyma brasiliensis GHG001]EST09593.1 Major facilitator superfamily [Kalmanozyma brasiliensis GHG001]
MSNASKEKIDETIYETKDNDFDRSPTNLSHAAEDESGIRFNQDGTPSDPAQYATWRRGIRKLDWRAVPALGLLWLANFIDRSNIGNAKVAGLTTDLKLDGQKFNIALAIFYITYIASEIPSNMMLRKLGAKFWLPFIVFAWGVVTVFLGIVKNFAGLIVVRLLLGLFEGGLLPGMPLYLSQLYPRYMVQVRIAYFYAGASLSGAFGGLLASGLIHMDGLGVQNRYLAPLRPLTARGVAGWRWIFLIEGLLTIVVACFAWWSLPASVRSFKGLKEDERELMLAVLGRDQQNNRAKAAGVAPILKADEDDAEKQQHTMKVSAPNALTAVNANAADSSAIRQGMVFEEEQFEWREVRRGLMEPQAWFLGIAYLLICNSLYSFSLFLPTILRGIYPDIATTRLQLLTVPPYVPATVLVIIVAYLSDKTRMRGPFMLALLPLSMIGYIMLLATNDAKVKYGATFLIALGLYPSAPCILALPINNNSGLYKRATVIALELMIANLAGFVATFIYQAHWAPKYVQGHSVALASLVGAEIFIAINVWWCWSENKAREAGKREGNWAAYQKLVDEGKTKAPIGDRSPHFRYTL